MKKSGLSPVISKQQLQRQKELRNTKTDLAKQSLISSEQWLQLHGLKRNKLTLKQILSQIGFPQCEDYVTSLGRLVTSRYAEGLFPQSFTTEDGKIYNLTAKSELIYPFMDYLTQAAESYRQRMEWLTSNSRQIFGVILEQCITIVLDFSDVLESELNLCRDALTMVFREQVAQITKFNIIWVSQEPIKWQDHATLVTEQSIAAAISWVEKKIFEPMVMLEDSSLEALLEAASDKTIESIYYFVVGDVPEECKEILFQRASEILYPVCIVAFNTRGEDTIAFLKSLSVKTQSRFHAFAERTVCAEFPKSPTKDVDNVITWNSRKLKGKLPPGAGVREDVFLIWRELEEACSTLAQVQNLVSLADCGSRALPVENEPNAEDTWDSKKWLEKYGLKAQKLSFYDVLAECSFRHADGVVDIKAKPEDESVQTSAESQKKTVHAKYCSKFMHSSWKDGSLVHVNITKEKCKWYSERIHTVMGEIQRRIKWIQNRSQNLFGKVQKDCIYVLIDTSHSMKNKLGLVKKKIIQFIQEQLKYKSKFNFVTFDAQAVAWREKLAEINESNLEKAQSWIRGIQVGSSTNTLNALKIAFADKETQVIYLLTDGRPDQPSKMVIDQVKVYQKIPIHTISFSYNDEIANVFLKELASLTGGEFHSYNFGCKDPTPQEVVQSEDLILLVQEMEKGYSDLQKVQSLYSESLVMDWWYNADKEGDNKHQKEISLMVSEDSAKPQLDVNSAVELPLNMLKVQWDLPNQNIPKKKILHAESTKTSLLRSQMSTPKSLAYNEMKDMKDGLSKGWSSWNTALSNKGMNLLPVNEYMDDKLLGKSMEEENQVYNSSQMSSAKWLQTHSLVAKKLTIMDALAATAVPHSPTYVPVLDKHVVSKVFDEVFPLAHVCNNTNKMTFINPQGVKLNIYKQKVEQAIKSYERRLNKIVWQALSQEEKEKLDSVKPIQYLENKAALNQALERLNWPISLKELSMLENEILAGKMYIQQAMELQEAAKKNCMNKAVEEQQKLQGNSTKKSKPKKVDPLKGHKVIARCDENGFYFPGVVKKCLSSSHALVEYRYGDTKIVPICFITPIGGAMPCPPLQVGDYVFAKIVIPEGFDFYVPAIVIALPKQNLPLDKFYTVLKCNNRREFCPRSSLIKISQNKYVLACSHIKSPPIQDSSKIENEEARNSTFRTTKEVDTEDLKDLRKKKRKPSKRLPVQETVTSDSDNSSHDNRSQESHSKTHPKPRVGYGGQHSASLEHSEIPFKNSQEKTLSLRIRTRPASPLLPPNYLEHTGPAPPSLSHPQQQKAEDLAEKR
ncbi:von Willebrand factor A domain-containing protein 3B [Dipodomys spectabilis]|uniref:von Willebrand factor A domain-containing protein 3B n=1 Tax=Dipodomys spectabilis TaxID=105255 RepID=UPI001C548B73|nr:von Willebrand factor A domain-containing protein 3B [Dipodomys spectabilis]